MAFPLEVGARTERHHVEADARAEVEADAAARLRGRADALVFLAVPGDFGAVGEAYREFDQTSDEAVAELLAAAVSGRCARRMRSSCRPPTTPART